MTTTAEFEEKKQDTRLIITHDECKLMMEHAAELETLHKPCLPHDFWNNHCEFGDRSTDGLVPLEDEDFEDGADYRVNPVSHGFVSQEIGLSQCQEDGNETSHGQTHGLDAIAMESSNLYQSCRSVYGRMCEQARISKNSKVESIIRRGLAATQRHVTEELFSQQEEKQATDELLSQQAEKQVHPEFVSFIPKMDTRLTAPRIPDPGESRQRNNNKGVRIPTRLDEGSLVPNL